MANEILAVCNSGKLRTMHVYEFFSILWPLQWTNAISEFYDNPLSLWHAISTEECAVWLSIAPYVTLLGHEEVMNDGGVALEIGKGAALSRLCRLDSFV